MRPTGLYLEVNGSWIKFTADYYLQKTFESRWSFFTTEQWPTAFFLVCSYEIPTKHLKVCGCDVIKCWTVNSIFIALQGTIYAHNELLGDHTHGKKEGLMTLSICRAAVAGLRSLCSLRLNRSTVSQHKGTRIRSSYWRPQIPVSLQE